MAVWEISIEKQLGGEYWINVYHGDVADQAAAQALGFQIATIESSVHQSTVTFTKYRVRQVGQLAGPGTVYPLGFPGTNGAADSLPLFCVQRVDFAVPVGRPSRKYLKLPVFEAAQSNGTFSQDHLTSINNSYSTPLLNLDGLSSNDGQTFVAIAANPVVGMRQLRRGSRKRTTPVIP